MSDHYNRDLPYREPVNGNAWRGCLLQNGHNFSSTALFCQSYASVENPIRHWCQAAVLALAAFTQRTIMRGIVTPAEQRMTVLLEQDPHAAGRSST